MSVAGSYRSRCTYGCVNQVSCRQDGKQWVGGEAERARNGTGASARHSQGEGRPHPRESAARWTTLPTAERTSPVVKTPNVARVATMLHGGRRRRVGSPARFPATPPEGFPLGLPHGAQPLAACGSSQALPRHPPHLVLAVMVVPASIPMMMGAAPRAHAQLKSDSFCRQGGAGHGCKPWPAVCSLCGAADSGINGLQLAP